MKRGQTINSGPSTKSVTRSNETFRSRIAKLNLALPNLQQLMRIGVAMVGIAAMALSCRKDWFLVPYANGSQLDAMGTGREFSIDTLKPSATLAFQIAAIMFVILIGASWIYRRRWSRISTALACLWLLAVFAFPYFVMIGDAGIASRATWLQMQHDNLTWLGGDINTAQEMSTVGWKNRVYVVDAPRQVAVIRLPSWSPKEFGPEHLPQLFEWLGYTNAFCQFLAKGWTLALVGGLALLLTTLFDKERLSLSRLGFAAGFLAIGAALYSVVAWETIFSASRLMATAGEQTTHGQYEQASKSLEGAARRLPLLREDTYYVAQRSLLDERLGRQTNYAAIQRANSLESGGFYAQALDQYQLILESVDPGSAIEREATRALLRYAVHALNSGNTSKATALLEQTLTIEPCNLKTIYMLQIAALRSGDHARLYGLVDYLYALCDHLRFPTKKVILATAQQHALYASMIDRDIDGAWYRLNKMRRP